jgi:putative transposase
VCAVLEVSRAGYYAWLSEVETAREQQDRKLMPVIANIFWKHKRRYGARRIAVELQAIGQPCGVDRVAKLLKNQGLQAIQPQGFKPKTTNRTASTRWATVPTSFKGIRRRRSSIACGSPTSPTFL